MTNEEKLRHYAGRANLLSEDVDYLLGLLRDAKAEAYEEAARVADRQYVAWPSASNEGYRDVARGIRALKNSLVRETVSSAS